MKVETPKKTKNSPESSLSRIGVDLSKSTFHVVGLDADGKKILRRKFNREGFKAWLARPDLPRGSSWRWKPAEERSGGGRIASLWGIRRC